MGNLLEVLYDLLLNPRRAFAEIAAATSLKQAALVVACSSLLAALSVLGGAFNGSEKLLLVILQLFNSIFTWIFSVAIWQLFAELLGGTGAGKQLLKSIGFISFLQILIVPVYLVAVLVPDAGAVLVAIAAVLVFVWSMALEIMAISAVHDISAAKAALVFFLPFLLFLALCIVVAFAVGLFFMSAASEILANPIPF